MSHENTNLINIKIYVSFQSNISLHFARKYDTTRNAKKII